MVTMPENLLLIVEAYLADRKLVKPLAPMLRKELDMIANGVCSAAESAKLQEAASPETIRARRKKLYAALHEDGAIAILSALLKIALHRAKEAA